MMLPLLIYLIDTRLSFCFHVGNVLLMGCAKVMHLFANSINLVIEASLLALMCLIDAR